MDQALKSSKSGHWCTPSKIVSLVEQVNHIALDPCSNPYSIVQADKKIMPPNNGLEASWSSLVKDKDGLVYVNPPYGREVKEWVKKLVKESEFVEVIALTAARVDTKWFQEDLEYNADSICFWKGRLKFFNEHGETDPAPFPSAISYFGPNVDLFHKAFRPYGFIHEP